MEDYSKDLLNSHQLTRFIFQKDQAKKEWEKNNDMYNLISKYRERLTFQRSMMMTEEELLNEQFRLARVLDLYEKSIEEAERAIYKHRVAVEMLHKSNKPFEGLDMKNIELIQQQLF